MRCSFLFLYLKNVYNKSNEMQQNVKESLFNEKDILAKR